MFENTPDIRMPHSFNCLWCKFKLNKLMKHSISMKKKECLKIHLIPVCPTASTVWLQIKIKRIN